MKKNSSLKPAALLLLQCLLSTALLAQAPLPKQWDYRFGGSSSDELQSLQQTTDGGYILGGYSGSGISGDKTEDSRGASDYWVVKIDANGTKEWDKRFGGSATDELQSLQQTTDGGYILGGTSYSGSGSDKTEASRGLSDYWVVKINANGIKEWDKRFGGTDYDNLQSLQQTTDGGYILGGYSASESGGDKSQPNWGTGPFNYDYWIVKIDANGVKQWDKRFGGTDKDYLRSLQQTTDGSYILGGHSSSGISGDKTEGSRGSDDYWVVKIDSNGIKQWDKRFGGTSADYFESLQQTTDGGYILGGYSQSGRGGDKSQPNWGVGLFTSLDYWIVKINANGVKEWDKRFGGTDHDYLQSLQQTTDGGYILGGYSESDSSGNKSQGHLGNLFAYLDYWIVKTDDMGVQQWDARFGGMNADDILTSIQQITDSSYVLGGYTFSHISASVTQPSMGSDDYWVLKLGCPPSAKIAIMGSLDICSTDSVILKADGSAGVKFQWYKDGRKIEGATDRSFTATLPGRYRVRVGTNWECGQISDVIIVRNSCGKVANNLAIFPNPSKGIVTLTYNSATAGNVQVNIFDKTGKAMFTKTEQAVKGKNTYQLNLSHLINGIYNLQITNSTEKSQTKLIIER